MSTNNKLSTHMTPSPGTKPKRHWWEASVFYMMLYALTKTWTHECTLNEMHIQL